MTLFDYLCWCFTSILHQWVPIHYSIMSIASNGPLLGNAGASPIHPFNRNPYLAISIKTTGDWLSMVWECSLVKIEVNILQPWLTTLKNGSIPRMDASLWLTIHRNECSRFRRWKMNPLIWRNFFCVTMRTEVVPLGLRNTKRPWTQMSMVLGVRNRE